MMGLVHYLFYLVRGTIRDTYTYLRLTPNTKGIIYFYNKKRKYFFSIKSRHIYDSLISNQILTFNDYNLNNLKLKYDVYSAYEDIIKKGRIPVIIDCGCNIGVSTRVLSDQFPKAKIIGIDPSEDNCKISHFNCKDLKNINFRMAAVGSEKGSVYIDNPDGSPSSYHVTRCSEDNNVDIITINDIIKENNKYDLLITKIDIEGFEDDLFSKNTEWVDQSNLIIIELHDWLFRHKSNSHNFLKTISNYNRDFIFSGENIYSIKN